MVSNVFEKLAVSKTNSSWDFFQTSILLLVCTSFLLRICTGMKNIPDVIVYEGKKLFQWLGQWACKRQHQHHKKQDPPWRTESRTAMAKPHTENVIKIRGKQTSN